MAGATAKLWDYMEKHGRAEERKGRRILDTPLKLRHLTGTDLDRMFSGSKLKWSRP
jgi:hypothetical protein